MDINIPSLKTPQELEQAIQRYRSGEWNGNKLFALWEAIRNAALAQSNAEPKQDAVPGEDSY